VSFGLIPDPPIEQKKTQLATDLLAGIKPRTAVVTQRPPLQESDKSAQAAGFTSREPVQRVATGRPTRRRRKQEESYALSMRCPASVLERFIAYAEKYRLSYPLALEQLLDESDGVAKNIQKI